MKKVHSGSNIRLDKEKKTHLNALKALFCKKMQNSFKNGEDTIGGGGRGTPYNGLFGEAPPERGIFFRLQVYDRVGISLVEV